MCGESTDIKSFCTTGSFIGTATWHCRKPLSQWERGFLVKAALPLAKMLVTAPCRCCDSHHALGADKDYFWFVSPGIAVRSTHVHAEQYFQVMKWKTSALHNSMQRKCWLLINFDLQIRCSPWVSSMHRQNHSWKVILWEHLLLYLPFVWRRYWPGTFDT